MKPAHRFIDIHSHFLPGLDDGPVTMDQCLETAEKYLAAGFSQVIATPHFIPGTRWTSVPDEIEAAVRDTRRALSAAGIELKLLPGMEIGLNDDLCRNFTADKLISLGGTGSYLVECSLNALPGDPVVMGLAELVQHGDCTFILAHPERCRVFQENPNVVHKLVEQGILIQINLSSLLGYSGEAAYKTAATFLRDGVVHFLATDSHGSGYRNPPDRKAFSLLEKLVGYETLVTALHDNPLRLLEGETVEALRCSMQGSSQAGRLLPSFTGLAEGFRRMLGNR
ncbi:MAG: tyrosine-protein phosphatase [Desulfobulbaceae bacterium]